MGDANESFDKISLETTRSLIILPLYEGAADDESWFPGLGVSYLIRTDANTILFDVGNNPRRASPSPLEANMQRLGVRLEDVDIIVISHQHLDHTGGIKWSAARTFSIGNSQVGLGERKVFVPVMMSYPEKELTVSSRPQRVVKAVGLTGTLFAVMSMPVVGNLMTVWEQSLAINVDGEGIVLVTGCGHPGLERMVSRAQAVFGLPVIGVVGGLHYTNADAEKLEPHILFLHDLKPKLVAISPHDSKKPALQAFRQAFAEVYREIKIGEEIRFS